MRLLVIDGNSIANRAFYGIKLLTTKDGRYTNAIFGFLNIMNSLLRECEPDEVAIAFDLKHPTFRHEMYDGYKGTRHAMPDELAQQMPILKELLTDLGYRQVSAKGWEADDILGTLAAACEARRDDCFLATGDRDSLQLVSETTTVLLATSAMGRSKTETMDLDAIHEKYGIEPKQLIEVKSLMGDTSDNIPGVKGIGEKTAMTLVKNFGTLDNVYDHLDSPIIKPRQRENLLACREDAYLSHTLGTIRTDAPIDTAEGAYKVTEGNKPAAVRLMQELEIQTLITRFGLDGIVPEQDPDTLPEVDAAIASLPAEPSGHYLVAARPAVLGKKSAVVQPEAWYAVQDTTVYPLSEEELVSLLDDPRVTLDVFDSAPLYARAMAVGSWGSTSSGTASWPPTCWTLPLPTICSPPLPPATMQGRRSPVRSTPMPVSWQTCFAKMKAEITENGEDDLYNNIEFPLAQVLADMTRTGILVDREGIEAFGVQLRQELDQVLTRIEMEAGTSDFNPNSPKQLGTLLFDTMGLPHGKKTKNGWSTDAETLEKLRDIPLVEDILQYRACQKLNSTYVEGLLKVIGEDGRIHTRFNQTEARTGRLSSDNPNLQNIPIRTEMGSKLRAYFVAKPGCVLVDADYSQIELRILAHVTGDAHMQEAFLSGADIHRSTAAKIYNIRPEDVTPRLRSSAKAINFGIMYGKGAYSLSKDIGVSVKGSRGLPADLSGHLPQYRRLYGKDHCGCPPVRLRFHPVRPPPRPAGAEQQQPQHPGQRRTDGPQHPHSGHGR